MKKDLVARVLAIVVMAGALGWFAHDFFMSEIERMASLPVADVAREAMTPAFTTHAETVFAFIAIGVTIVILAELFGFFIRIILFRKVEETNIIHNHNITLQMPSVDEPKKEAI